MDKYSQFITLFFESNVLESTLMLLLAAQQWGSYESAAAERESKMDKDGRRY